MDAPRIEFLDNEEGYLSWVGANPGGLVLNVRRTVDPGYVVLRSWSVE